MNEAKHTPWIKDVDGSQTRTIEEVAFFAGPNAPLVIRAVNSHEAILVALKDMSKTYHEITQHEGYFHNCSVPWCVENRAKIAQAEAKS